MTSAVPSAGEANNVSPPLQHCLGARSRREEQGTQGANYRENQLSPGREGRLASISQAQTPGTAAPLYRVHRALHPRDRNPFLAVRTHHLTMQRKAPADRPGHRNGPESPPRQRGPEAFGIEVIPRNREL